MKQNFVQRRKSQMKWSDSNINKTKDRIADKRLDLNHT